MATKKPFNQVDIHFSVDPADRSVGIMAEGFAAWFTSEVPGFGPGVYVELREMGDSVLRPVFEWFDGDADPGDSIDRPKSGFAGILEQALWAFVVAWYAAQETGDEV